MQNDQISPFAPATEDDSAFANRRRIRPQTTTERVISLCKREPWIPFGTLLVTGAFVNAARSFRKGRRQEMNYWLRWRVGLQGISLPHFLRSIHLLIQFPIFCVSVEHGIVHSFLDFVFAFIYTHLPMSNVIPIIAATLLCICGGAAYSTWQKRQPGHLQAKPIEESWQDRLIPNYDTSDRTRPSSSSSLTNIPSLDRLNTSVPFDPNNVATTSSSILDKNKISGIQGLNLKGTSFDPDLITAQNKSTSWYTWIVDSFKSKQTKP